MKPCPVCGVSLPDQASFCARCGHAFIPAQAQASRLPGGVGRSEAQAKIEQENRQAFSGPPNTPQPGKIQNVEIHMTPIPPSPQNTSSPGEANKKHGEILPAHPAAKQAPDQNIEALETREIPATPPPTQSGPKQGQFAHVPSPPTGQAEIEARKTLIVPNVPQTPQPSGNTSNGAQKMREIPATPPPTQARPHQGQPARAPSPPTGQAEIEAQKTLIVPNVPRTPQPSGNTSNGAQKMRAIPAMGKIPPSTPRQPIEDERKRHLVEMQKTQPVSTVTQLARNGPPSAYPRPNVYANGAPVMPGGARPAGNMYQRPGMTLAPARGIPTGAPPPTRASIKKKPLIWRIISPIFTRAHDPEPEKPVKSQPQTSPLGWLPVMALTCALGLFTVATAYNAARNNAPGSELYFWLGLGLIFVPTLARIILPLASRIERVGSLMLVTLCLYLARVALSPLRFNGYDEYLHWRTVNDIMSTGHLFAYNPLLPVSPYYSGLEIVTSAFSNLSGLSTFVSGLVVVGFACMLTIISFFLLCEQLTGSARLASIATMIYMTNPHFLFFDTQFAYESMAIPLATFVLFAMTRYEALSAGRPWVLLVAWFVLTAMDVTHHLTNFIFEALFLLWGAIYLFLRPLPLRKSIVILTIFFGLAVTVTTVLMIGNTVVGYFASFFADVGGEIARTLGSSGQSSRTLFSDAGTQTPFWERLISLGTVGLVTLSIPFLLLCFWRRYRRNALVWTFAIIVIFYPVLQVLRLTTSGAEASDRASAFMFLAISFLAAVAIVQFWPVRLLNWKQPTVLSATILMLFMGGIILGEGIPPAFMPGPYQVSADGRSVDAIGIQAALWANENLGANNRIYTDRINQLLMSAYGDQYLVTQIGDKIDETDVFFDPTWQPNDVNDLIRGRVHYLVVDLRLHTGPPQDGFFFEQGESSTPADANGMRLQLLTKFDSIPNINRIYDNGSIVIYDTGEIINAPQQP